MKPRHNRLCGSEEFPVTNSTTFYLTRFTAGNAEVAINRAGTHLTSERSPLVNECAMLEESQLRFTVTH
jgi:hypothetical protein